MEEIIIDGVDVAGCDNLYEKDDMICVDNGIEESCQGNNCYYKQLKRTQNVLQEIKAIAEKEIYMKQNSSMDRILDLITKAEEE